jgi:hypothetical protein
VTWLAILKLVLTFADKIADIIRANQLIDAGEQKQIAAQLSRIAATLKVAREVSDETARMTEAELDKELAGEDEL